MADETRNRAKRTDERLLDQIASVLAATRQVAGEVVESVCMTKDLRLGRFDRWVLAHDPVTIAARGGTPDGVCSVWRSEHS